VLLRATRQRQRGVEREAYPSAVIQDKNLKLVDAARIAVRLTA
jgi:hypothetical protein